MRLVIGNILLSLAGNFNLFEESNVNEIYLSVFEWGNSFDPVISEKKVKSLYNQRRIVGARKKQGVIEIPEESPDPRTITEKSYYAKR